MIHTVSINRVHLKWLSKALFAGKVWHLVANSNAAEPLWASFRRAAAQGRIGGVARPHDMPNIVLSSCLAAAPLNSRCSRTLYASLHKCPVVKNDDAKPRQLSQHLAIASTSLALCQLQKHARHPEPECWI